MNKIDSDKFFRLNFLNFKITERSHNSPVWAQKLVLDVLSEFCKEFKMTKGFKVGDEREIHTIFGWIESKLVTLDQVVDIFQISGINVEPYDISPFKSFGVIIPLENEKVTEYRIKYG